MLDNLFGGSSKKKKTRRGLPPHPPGYEESEAGFIDSSYPQQQFQSQIHANQTLSPGFSSPPMNLSQNPAFTTSPQFSQPGMQQSFPPEQIAEYARQLFAEGYSEPQVVNELRKQGVPFQTIDYVIKQVLRNNIMNNQSVAPQTSYAEDSYESFSFDSLTPRIRDIENQGIQQEESFGYGEEESAYEDYSELGEETEENYSYDWKDVNRLEEVVEAVLEERLKDFLQKLNELEMKIKTLETGFEGANEKIENIKKTHESDINSIKNTISDINERINKLEPKLNGFEKAFKDIVPELVDEVKELKEIINLKIKREEKMEKITL